jgi:hypothetical protein
MVSAGMLRRVALVRTDVSEELSASFIRVTRIGELGTTLAATSNRRTLRRNTSVLTRATRHNIPEDTILHSHRRGNLKSYTVALLVVVLLATRRHRTVATGTGYGVGSRGSGFHSGQGQQPCDRPVAPIVMGVYPLNYTATAK